MRILGARNDEGKEEDTRDRERRRNETKHTEINQGGWQHTRDALLPVHWELENAMLDDVWPYATPPYCGAQHSLESWNGARRSLTVVQANPWSGQ